MHDIRNRASCHTTQRSATIPSYISYKCHCFVLCSWIMGQFITHFIAFFLYPQQGVQILAAIHKITPLYSSIWCRNMSRIFFGNAGWGPSCFLKCSHPLVIPLFFPFYLFPVCGTPLMLFWSWYQSEILILYFAFPPVLISSAKLLKGS